MTFKYAVLGAGRQGIAAAYDLARWGEAETVILADQALAVSTAGAKRVNQLLDGAMVVAAHVDVRDRASLGEVLHRVDAFLSAVPYKYNLEIAQQAVRAGANMCDLGGNTNIVRQQHKLNPQAQEAGISIIPDCGQVPGMGATLMVHAMEMLDKAEEVFMWDGGIPQKPRTPFRYLLTFNIAGLTNEYAEPAVFLREGEIVQVEPMTELERVEFPEPIGTLEAFVAGGGTSTMPWTYQGKLRTLQNLTLRHPGHFSQLRAFYDLGLWDLTPVRIGPMDVVPRDVFHALFEPKVTFPEDKDLVIVRVKALGTKGGQRAQSFIELIDYYDEETGFTAMERATGWSAAIVAQMMARGETPRGAGGVESFVAADRFVEELHRRGFNLSARVEILP
jgi:lysine 6-dehydrogenase